MAEINYGEVSARAGDKHKVLRGTKVNPRFQQREEEFEGRSGRRDQGGVRLRGRPEAGSRHIDKRQSMGSPAHAGGAPSRGGGAGAQKQPLYVDHIDAAALQQPEFREGGNSPAVKRGQFRTSIPGGGKKSPGRVGIGRPSARGAPPMQKAGRQSGYYSADTRRP